MSNINFTGDKHLKVGEPSSAFMYQRQIMKLSHDLMGGNSAMRSAGKRYVEKGEGETDAEYSTRLNRPALLNSFKRTLSFLRGQVFQKPVFLDDTASENILAWSEDVDKQGHNLTTWAANVFEAGLRDGVTFTLVDYPAIQIERGEDGVTRYYDDATDTWRPKTQAADLANAWKPYLVHIPAGKVLDCWITTKAGMPIVEMFRYLEISLESDGSNFGRQEVQRVRVVRPDTWQVFVKHAGQSEFVPESEGSNSLGIVPLAIFMAGDEITDCTAMPALDDLAELNRRYWAAICGHCELMEYVRRPVWFGKMLRMDEDTKIAMSAGTLIDSTDPDASLQNLGIDATSPQASQIELETLKQDMAMYGLQLLQPKTGSSITATEVERDSQENNSTLRCWTLNFQDFLENCLLYVGAWLGENDTNPKSGASVALNTEFTLAVSKEHIISLYNAKLISMKTAHMLLKKASVLPDDFDSVEEKVLITQELMTNSSVSRGYPTIKPLALGSDGV